MKESKLKKGLTILIIIAICLISFFGIFVNKQGQMKNILPEFRLGMNLEGRRVVGFSVSDKTEEIVYDASGNVTTEGKNEDGSLKEGYTKENKPVNAEELKNENNYKTVKRVMENRLKNMGVSEYIIRLDNNNGDIVIELPEDANTDRVLSDLTYVGKFEIKDSDTDEVLIDHQEVKSAYCTYGSTSTGTAVYLNIEFKEDGKRKLEDITKTYISSKDEEGKTITKNVSIELDGESILETYFGETITTGILPLSIGSATTSSETITSYIEQASEIAGLITAGTMPISYQLEENNYISQNMDNLTIKVLIGIIMALLIVVFIYWVVRYKINGIFAVVSYLGFIAITLLVIRYTNVVLAIEALAAMISLLVATYMVLEYTLKQFTKKDANKLDIIKETYKHYASTLCPFVIIAVVFTFINWLPISSIGMVLFWGMTILVLYYYVIVKVLFDIQEVKK